jgi:hypothetical protein
MLAEREKARRRYRERITPHFRMMEWIAADAGRGMEQ